MKPQVIHGFVEVKAGVWMNPHGVARVRPPLEFEEPAGAIIEGHDALCQTSPHSVPELLTAFAKARSQQYVGAAGGGIHTRVSRLEKNMAAAKPDAVGPSLRDWLYIQSEHGENPLWTVGFYRPGDDKWIAESDHRSSEEAAKRAHYLNGGGAP